MNQTATLAGGCFWCTEAIFTRLNGVIKVTPGYAGGDGINPTYEEVSTGTTGYAEAIQIEFDPSIITYEDILEVFFATHDPTTLNKQGDDVGTQYRSVVFYHTQDQERIVKSVIHKLQSKFAGGIATEVAKFESFTVAEDYHKNYYKSHPDTMYCKLVIDPKINKLMNDFGAKLKT